jgi:hypothetical protein
MNWYKIAYDTEEGRRMRLISAEDRNEAIGKLLKLSPHAKNFDAEHMFTGIRTK